MKLPHLNSSFKARETQDKSLSQLQKYVCSVTQALHGKLVRDLAAGYLFRSCLVVLHRTFLTIVNDVHRAACVAANLQDVFSINIPDDMLPFCDLHPSLF